MVERATSTWRLAVVVQHDIDVLQWHIEVALRSVFDNKSLFTDCSAHVSQVNDVRCEGLTVYDHNGGPVALTYEEAIAGEI